MNLNSEAKNTVLQDGKNPNISCKIVFLPAKAVHVSENPVLRFVMFIFLTFYLALFVLSSQKDLCTLYAG